MTDVTFSPQQLQQVIAEAVAVALAAQEAKPVPKNTSVDAKTDAALKMDVLVCRAFKRAGFGDVQPGIETWDFAESFGLNRRAVAAVKAYQHASRTVH